MSAIVTSLLLASALSSGVPAPRQEAQQSTAEAEALELFRTSCLACHAPPDRRFAVDRAWLSQVADTA